MSDNTGIEWTDATWNPVTGCTPVSAGCDHCYARTFAERWRGVPGHHFERGFDLTAAARQTHPAADLAHTAPDLRQLHVRPVPRRRTRRLHRRRCSPSWPPPTSTPTRC